MKRRPRLRAFLACGLLLSLHSGWWCVGMRVDEPVPGENDAEACAMYCPLKRMAHENNASSLAPRHAAAPIVSSDEGILPTRFHAHLPHSGSRLRAEQPLLYAEPALNRYTPPPEV